MSEIELFHFTSSHFNEKARWTLELKRVPHSRTSFLPGPHLAPVQKLTGGSTVPAIRDSGVVIAGSAEIIDHLEAKFPEPALYPEDPAQRERALAIQREFDDEVGPAVRLALFFDVLDGEFATAAFAVDKSAAAKLAYRVSFPLIHPIMIKRIGINAESATVARDRVTQALDFVVKESAETGYLVGDRFSVADLCCASLLMLTARVGEFGGPDMHSNERVDSWLARWADHPGTDWVREIFRRHRRP